MNVLKDFIAWRKENKDQRLLAQLLDEYEISLIRALADNKPLPLTAPVETGVFEGPDHLENIRDELFEGYKRLHKKYVDFVRNA